LTITRLRWLESAVLTALLFGSNYCAYAYMNTPLLASGVCFMSVIATLKLISYTSVNAEFRAVYQANPSDTQCAKLYGAEYAYPRNLTAWNLMYFAMAPTLCYQPSYPRTQRFRKFFFARRLIEVVTLSLAMYFLAEQYSRPILQNAIKPIQDLNALALFERVLKLAIPSIYIWLIMFYLIFHSYLNLWAEIMRFGDRAFYRPWWNATTIAEYWRLWNLPMYRWFKRHIYVPLLARGYPRWVAGLSAFFVSAIGHEVLVGIPVKVFEGWAFWAMMLQVPLIWLTESIKNLETTWLASAWSSVTSDTTTSPMASSSSSQAPVSAVSERRRPFSPSAESTVSDNSTTVGDTLNPPTLAISSTSSVNGDSDVGGPAGLSALTPLSADGKKHHHHHHHRHHHHHHHSRSAELEGRSRSGILGNYIFWLSFCILGQPVGVLLYYRAWFLRQHPELAAGDD
jgi:hypothetical protein